MEKQFLKNNLVFFFVLLCFSPSKADVSLSAPQLIKMNKGKLFKKLFGEKSEVEVSFSDQLESHEIGTNEEKLVFKDISFQANVAAKAQYRLWLENQLAFSGQSENFLFKMGELKYILDKMQYVGGNQVRLKMEITCYDIQLSGNEKMAFSAFTKVNPKGKDISLDFDRILFFNDLKNLKLSFGSCYGPNGSIDEIKRRLADTLKDTASLSGLLKPFLKESLNKKVIEIKESLKKSSPLFTQKDLVISQAFKKIYFCGKDSVCVLGDMTATLSNTNWDSHSDLGVSPEGLSYWENKDIAPENFAAQLIPEALIRWILREGYAYNFMTYQTQTDDHKALKDLMKSRFKQGFVWKDLKNFPKGTNLYVYSKASMPPKTGEMLELEDGLSLDFSADVVSQVFAPKDQQYQSYAFLNTKMAGKLEINIKNSELKIILKGEGSETSHNFDPIYVEKYAPNNDISKRRINDAVNDMFENMVLLKHIPKLQIREGIELEVKRIKKMEEDHLLLLFD